MHHKVESSGTVARLCYIGGPRLGFNGDNLKGPHTDGALSAAQSDSDGAGRSSDGCLGGQLRKSPGKGAGRRYSCAGGAESADMRRRGWRRSRNPGFDVVDAFLLVASGTAFDDFHDLRTAPIRLDTAFFAQAAPYPLGECERPDLVVWSDRNLGHRLVFGNLRFNHHWLTPMTVEATVGGHSCWNRRDRCQSAGPLGDPHGLICLGNRGAGAAGPVPCARNDRGNILIGAEWVRRPAIPPDADLRRRARRHALVLGRDCHRLMLHTWRSTRTGINCRERVGEGRLGHDNGKGRLRGQGRKQMHGSKE